MRATIVLTPAESKRLIAKSIAKKDEIKRAMERAYVILCEGSTNVMIAQEIFGLSIACENFTCGMSVGRTLCNSKLEVRSNFPLVAYKGKLVDLTYKEALEDFNLDTVIIKGGNAIDKDGFVGTIVSGYDGGVIANVLGTSVSQGIKIICPIGLEKCIFSVREAARYTGGKRFDYSMGPDYGLFILSNTDVVTEIEAIKLLTGIDAYHVASGGIGGSEGAVILSCEGCDNNVKKLIKIIEKIKGEPCQKGIRQKCTECKYVNCIFYKKDEELLPEWM